MRSRAACLLLLAGSAAAFRAPSALARPLAARAVAPSGAHAAGSRRVAVVAFGGDDKFLEASMDADSFGAKLGTPLGKVALQGIVAVSAAAGWGIAPSVRPVVKGIFAAAAAAGGLAARRKMLVMRREAASSVLAKLLSQKGVSNVGLAEAWELAQSYGVTEEDFAAQLASLLATYLEACIRFPQAKTAELSDLLSMRRSFNLGFDVTGDAVYGVAMRFYSEQRAYFQAEEEHESKQKLDKLVYLADRLLCEDPSEEGFRYERMRICKKFGFDDKEWARRVERVGAPFYRELLGNVAKDPSAINERDLAAVGKQLGLSDATTEAMKVDELRRVVGGAIDASGGKFTGSQLEKIKAMVGSLGLSEGQYRDVVESAVGPLFSAAAADSMAELERGPDEAATTVLAKLAVRQQELDISTETATALEMAAARQRAGKLVQGALTHLRAQNTRGAYEQMGKLVAFGRRLALMVGASGKAAAGASRAEILQTYLDPSLVRSCSDSEAAQLYRVFTLECLQGGRLDPADSERLDELRALLGVSVAVSQKMFEDSAAPIYEDKLAEATAAPAESFPPTLAAELKELAEQLSLPEGAARAARVGAYKRRLVERAGDGKIPSEADEAVLNALLAALELDNADVEAAHIEVCAKSYQASVREVMGTSGVIKEEYWAGLKTLQTRLRLPDEVAEEIYLGEAKEKLKEYAVKGFTAMMEASKKELDAGREGGDVAKLNEETRSVVIAESANILDFVRDAKLVVDVPGAGPISKVNLQGCIDSQALSDFYKAYLAECFRGGEASERRFEQAPLLSKVLGLSAGEVDAVQQGLGAQIYKTAIIRALNEKGQLQDEDRQFLQGIKEALGMDESLCDRLLLDMKVLRINGLIDRMFEASEITQTNVAAIRTSAEGLGLEIGSKEVGVQEFKLLRMLRCEAEACIEAGEAPPEDTSRLGELQEAYGLPQYIVEREIEDLLNKRCARHLLQAATALRRGNAEQVQAESEQLILFNVLNPFAVPSNAVQSDERGELLMRFQSSCLKKGPLTDDDRKRIDALRTALGLTGAPIAAAEETVEPSAPTPNVL